MTQYLSTPLLIASLLVLISAGLHLRLGNRPLAGALGVVGLVGMVALLIPSRPALLAVTLLGAAVALPACAAAVCLSQPPTRGSTRLILGLTGVACALVAGQSLVHEPFRDPACRSWCPRSPLLVAWEPALGWAFLATSTVLTVAVWVLAGARSLSAVQTRPTLNRATGGFGLVTTGIGLAVAAALLTSGRAAVSVTTLSTRTSLTVLLWWGVTAVALTAAFAQMLTLARVARLGETMTQADDARAAQDLLRDALADPAARLYPADGHGSFRDAQGREVPPPGPTRQQTVLSRGGVPVAVLDHAPGIAPDSLRRRLGPSVLLTLHNDSLRRQLGNQVTELTASRRRVVAQADATRAALERDLHDGAQQRVLALRIATSQGQSAATARGEVHVADAFQEAGRAAQQALEGLRALASGIHPAILEGAGLSAALQHLADSHPTPFILEADSLPKMPRDLQRTTFAIVRDAARDGVSRVSASCDKGDLHLGVATNAGITDTVRDRVAAAGGTLRERTDGWEARLPCE